MHKINKIVQKKQFQIYKTYTKFFSQVKKNIILYIYIKKSMKFKTIEELLQTIDKNENYDHEIKGKRLKKQFKAISQTNFQNVQFKYFIINDVAICIHVNVLVEEDKNKNQVSFIIRLDRQYPFNPPQIFCQSQGKYGEYGYSKDLLPHILKKQIWVPSLTLPGFIQKLPSLANSISKGEKISWSYHNEFEYSIDQLQNSGLKLYQVQQYNWQYKFIKVKKLKTLGLTPDYILKFQKQANNNKILKLQLNIPIKQITQAQAKIGKKYYQLQLTYSIDNKTQKIYLGGQQKDLEIILDNLNPIQMTQRKVKDFQKSGKIDDYNEAIKCYSTLIQYYSLSNKEKMDYYMTKMKKLIKEQYDYDENKQNKMREVKT